jgi:hypothetical protein
MKKVFQKVFSLFKKADPARNGKAKTRGQSLVEVAIALPFLIILFTGMMEFGFMLNFYLSLLDATREAARFSSGGDPMNDPNYYSVAASLVRGALDPQVVDPSYTGRRLILDPAVDDVAVTVYCVYNGVAKSYPSGGPYRIYNNVASDFSTTRIQNTYLSGAPDAGLVLVEVFYSYHPVVGVFYNKPIMLRAHTIMPANAADPSPTTGCP